MEDIHQDKHVVAVLSYPRAGTPHAGTPLEGAVGLLEKTPEDVVLALVHRVRMAEEDFRLNLESIG